jgi:flagellar biogenesis protein FliO
MKAWAPTPVVLAIAGLLCAVLLAPVVLAQSGTAGASAGARVETNPPVNTTKPTVTSVEPVPPAPATAAPVEASGEPRKPVVNPDEDRPIDAGDESSNEPTAEGSKTWNPGWLGLLWPLALVLTGIFVMFWAAKRYLPGLRRMAGSRAVEILGRTYLTPRQSVTVVKLGRRVLVIGQTAEQLSALASITDPEEVSEIVGLCESAGGHSSTATFRKIFQRMDREYEGESADAAPPAGAATDDVSQEDLDRVRGELRSLAEKVRQVSDGRKKES